MKRIILSVLILTILVALTACGSNPALVTDFSTEDNANTIDSFSAADGSSESNVNSESDEPATGSASDNQPDGHPDVRPETSPKNPANSNQPPVKPTEPPVTQSDTVKLTFSEGISMVQIFQKLEANGVADFDELMKTAQNYDYSYYELVGAQQPNSNRCFKLEGYLFPNTYEFYRDMKPQDAIGKFLRGGKAEITSSMMNQIKSSGYTADEILTIASIIQDEGSKSGEMSKVSAVIHNRLKKGMKLQMDSTIEYIEKYVKPYISGDVNRYNSFYNTYKCSALPSGPICNPGLSAIRAAINPADCAYLYFCNDQHGNYYYADTFAEHEENIKKAGIKVS